MSYHGVKGEHLLEVSASTNKVIDLTDHMVI